MDLCRARELVCCKTSQQTAEIVKTDDQYRIVVNWGFSGQIWRERKQNERICFCVLRMCLGCWATCALYSGYPHKRMFSQPGCCEIIPQITSQTIPYDRPVSSKRLHLSGGVAVGLLSCFLSSLLVNNGDRTRTSNRREAIPRCSQTRHDGVISTGQAQGTPA